MKKTNFIEKSQSAKLLKIALAIALAVGFCPALSVLANNATQNAYAGEKGVAELDAGQLSDEQNADQPSETTSDDQAADVNADDTVDGTADGTADVTSSDKEYADENAALMQHNGDESLVANNTNETTKCITYYAKQQIFQDSSGTTIDTPAGIEIDATDSHHLTFNNFILKASAPGAGVGYGFIFDNELDGESCRITLNGDNKISVSDFDEKFTVLGICNCKTANNFTIDGDGTLEISGTAKADSSANSGTCLSSVNQEDKTFNIAIGNSSSSPKINFATQAKYSSNIYYGAAETSTLVVNSGTLNFNSNLQDNSKSYAAVNMHNFEQNGGSITATVKDCTAGSMEQAGAFNISGSFTQIAGSIKVDVDNIKMAQKGSVGGVYCTGSFTSNGGTIDAKVSNITGEPVMMCGVLADGNFIQNAGTINATVSDCSISNPDCGISVVGSTEGNESNPKVKIAGNITSTVSSFNSSEYVTLVAVDLGDDAQADVSGNIVCCLSNIKFSGQTDIFGLECDGECTYVQSGGSIECTFDGISGTENHEDNLEVDGINCNEGSYTQTGGNAIYKIGDITNPGFIGMNGVCCDGGFLCTGSDSTLNIEMGNAASTTSAALVAGVMTDTNCDISKGAAVNVITGDVKNYEGDKDVMNCGLVWYKKVDDNSTEDSAHSYPVDKDSTFYATVGGIDKVEFESNLNAPIIYLSPDEEYLTSQEGCEWRASNEASVAPTNLYSAGYPHNSIISMEESDESSNLYLSYISADGTTPAHSVSCNIPPEDNSQSGDIATSASTGDAANSGVVALIAFGACICAVCALRRMRRN